MSGPGFGPKPANWQIAQIVQFLGATGGGDSWPSRGARAGDEISSRGYAEIRSGELQGGCQSDFQGDLEV